MKKTFLFALLSLITLSANSQNPFVQTWYTSDPAPLVHGDRLYARHLPAHLPDTRQLSRATPARSSA